MPRELDLFSLLLTILGGLTAAGGALGLIYALARLPGLVGRASSPGTEVGGILLGSLVIGGLGVALVSVARGLRRQKRWAWFGGLAVSVLFPFVSPYLGIPIAVAGLYILLKPEVRERLVGRTG